MSESELVKFKAEKTRLSELIKDLQQDRKKELKKNLNEDDEDPYYYDTSKDEGNEDSDSDDGDASKLDGTFKPPPGYEKEWKFLKKSMMEMNYKDPNQRKYINLLYKHVEDLISVDAKEPERDTKGWWVPDELKDKHSKAHLLKGKTIKPQNPTNWDDLYKVQEFFYKPTKNRAKKKRQKPSLYDKIDAAERRARQAKVKLIKKFKEHNQKVKIYPKNKCPKNVMLPFDPKPFDELGKRINWIDQKPNSLLVTSIRVGKAKPLTPGWLINLNPPEQLSLNLIRRILTEMNLKEDATGPIESIHYILDMLGIELQKSAVAKLLQWIPRGLYGGLSFPIFLLGLGNFERTKKYNMFLKDSRTLVIEDDPSKYDEEQIVIQVETPPASNESVEQQKPKVKMPKPFVTILYYDKSGELTERYKKRMDSTDSSEEEVPPFPVRNKLDYTPVRERKPMRFWRRRVREQRERHKLIRLEKTKQREKDSIETQLAHQRIIQERKLNIKREQERIAQEKIRLKEEARIALEEKKRKQYEDAKLRAEISKEKGLSVMHEERLWEMSDKRKHTYKGRKHSFMEPGTYSRAEKVAYSGLLFFYMHDFMKRLTKVYENGFIPVHDLQKEIFLYDCRMKQRNGCPPFKQSEWNKFCLPKLRSIKHSQDLYLTPFDLVTKRKEKVLSKKTNQIEYQIKTDYLRMELPPKGDGPVILTENRSRIKKMIQYLFKRDRDPLAILPNLHEIIHYSEPHLGVSKDLIRAESSSTISSFVSIKRPSKIKFSIDSLDAASLTSFQSLNGPKKKPSRSSLHAGSLTSLEPLNGTKKKPSRSSLHAGSLTSLVQTLNGTKKKPSRSSLHAGSLMSLPTLLDTNAKTPRGSLPAGSLMDKKRSIVRGSLQSGSLMDARPDSDRRSLHAGSLMSLPTLQEETKAMEIKEKQSNLHANLHPRFSESSPKQHEKSDSEIGSTHNPGARRSETSKIRYATPGAAKRSMEIAIQERIRKRRRSRSSSSRSFSQYGKQSNKKKNSGDIDLWIKKEAKKLRPQASIPKYLFTKHNHLNKRDAEILKARYDIYIKREWAHLVKKRLKFREELWKKLDVGGIQSDKMRLSFIRAFFQLMPHKTTNQPAIPYNKYPKIRL